MCLTVPGAAKDPVLVLNPDLLVSMEMYNMYDSRDLLLIYCGRLVLFRCVRRYFLLLSVFLHVPHHLLHPGVCAENKHLLLHLLTLLVAVITMTTGDNCCSWMLNKVQLYKRFLFFAAVFSSCRAGAIPPSAGFKVSPQLDFIITTVTDEHIRRCDTQFLAGCSSSSSSSSEHYLHSCLAKRSWMYADS